MTWDIKNFGIISDFLENLKTKGRSLVVIIDPHIKVDTYYFLYKNAIANGNNVLT
jgi:alpha-glucosidase (family GH31 glycosyl hydrolase)